MQVVRRARRSGCALIVALSTTALWALPVRAISAGEDPPAARFETFVPDPHAARNATDPLVPMLLRMRSYFRSHASDGVTLDSRYSVNPSEAIRLSVVCQLLGLFELYRNHPDNRVRHEIVEHADYLLPRLDQISSHTPFDGMLCYSLLAAYDATRESRFLNSGTTMVDELKAIPTWQCVLNGGLMVAMATAEYCKLTGDAIAEQKTRDILSSLAGYQNPDGSFPHWCYGSEDIHYTGWMSQELVLIGRTLPDPQIEPTLERMESFMEGRVDVAGRSHYEALCADGRGDSCYFDSRRSGCGIDYDTRAWTVEPGYNALLFDHLHSPKYLPVIHRLLALENHGTFADKWDFIPPPEDPEYPWSIADTSVANMSIIFWTLATIMGGRAEAFPADSEWADGEDPPVLHGPSSDPRSLTDGALSAAGLHLAGGRLLAGGDPLELRFTLPRAATVTLAIYDPAGRRVRELFVGSASAGTHRVRWDGRGRDGRPAASGVYFARLVVGGEYRSVLLSVVR